MLVNMFYSAFIAMFSTMCGYVVAAVDFGGREQSLKQEVEQLRERVEELEGELTEAKKDLAEAKKEYDELYEEDDEYIERKREEFKAELAKKDDMIGMLVFSMAGGVMLTALVIFASIVKASPLLR